ncbi:MAG: DUF3047 domain-containing protein [Desulfuromonadales bacterium]|nr:DUF3047 domain-containing protein [Desulfuromonadales bacterium]
MIHPLRSSLLACLSLLLAATAFAANADIRVVDDFNAGLDPRWETKKFNGQTDYRVVALGEEKVLMAQSESSASALILKMQYDLRDYPVLSWRWKTNNIHPKGDGRTKAGDDYAARVYVVFPHWFTPMTRSINYIWANRLPEGSSIPSPYTGNSIMVAAQSGPGKIGQWVMEKHNVWQDYRRIFGEDPPPVGAIAIMTDSDDTGGSALAWYDDIRIEKERKH